MPIQFGGSVKCLGIHYDLDLIGATQYDMFMAELQHVVAIARTRRASPDMLRAVSKVSLLNMVANRGVLSGWSLEAAMKFDGIIAMEYRTAQTENIFQPP